MKQLARFAAALLLTIAAMSTSAVAAGPSPEDPAGDGLNSCSVDDCKVCNNNGLMCTPTPTGCNCDFWDS
jgi:hypothetical protein